MIRTTIVLSVRTICRIGGCQLSLQLNWPVRGDCPTRTRPDHVPLNPLLSSAPTIPFTVVLPAAKIVDDSP